VGSLPGRGGAVPSVLKFPSPHHSQPNSKRCSHSALFHFSLFLFTFSPTHNSRPSVFCHLSSVQNPQFSHNQRYSIHTSSLFTFPFYFLPNPQPATFFLPSSHPLSTRRPIHIFPPRQALKAESVHTSSLLLLHSYFPQASCRPIFLLAVLRAVKAPLTTHLRPVKHNRTDQLQRRDHSATFHSSLFLLHFLPRPNHTTPTSQSPPLTFACRVRAFPSNASHAPRAIPSRRPALIPLRAFGSPARPRGHPAPL